MSTLIIFAGPNGSGKSSARDAIVNPVEVVIDPDRIARTVNSAAKEALELFERASGKDGT